MNTSKLTRQEFDAMWKDLDKEILDALWEGFQKAMHNILEEEDYSLECSMCGKPIRYRESGMCPHCQMVWNS